MSDEQVTLFDAVREAEKGTVPMERPESWEDMLFPVAYIDVFSNNEEVKSIVSSLETEFIRPVENVPVIVSTINDYKGILNVNDGVVISVVKKTYTAVSNIDVLEHFEKLLREQNVRFEYGFARNARNGRKSVFEIILPDMKIDLGNGDTQELRLYVQNSFDGGNSIKLDMGFFRHRCSNMALMVGKAEVQYKTSHIGDADERIKTTFDMYLTEKFNEAKDFVGKLNRYGFKNDMEIDELIDDEKNVIVADKYRAVVKEVFVETYKPEFGNLYWGLYNAYTYVITHEMRGNEIGKMDKLVKLSNMFNELIEKHS